MTLLIEGVHVRFRLAHKRGWFDGFVSKVDGRAVTVRANGRCYTVAAEDLEVVR